MSRIEQTKQINGFTIVELLIVIVVIGILAAITVVAYNGIQERAQTTQANSELATLAKAMRIARINEGTVIGEVTGSYCTTCGDQTRYETTLSAISDASGTNLDALKDGDPWGNPYAIDENQGEGTGVEACNHRDRVYVRPAHSGVDEIRLPLYSSCVP